MEGQVLNVRIFNWQDQQRFAELTGDINPMHMDPVAARRTQAGAPVVHGVHSLLWLFDEIGRKVTNLPSIVSLRVKFSRMIYVGEKVTASLEQVTGSHLHAAIIGESGVAIQMNARFGARNTEAENDVVFKLLTTDIPTEPIDHAIEDMPGQAGSVKFNKQPAEYARIFPAAAMLLGDQRLAALGGLTFLVGMMVPGLHSIFGGLKLTLYEEIGTSGAIQFRTTAVDTRFRLIRLAVRGAGIEGELEAFARLPPAHQASCPAVASKFSGNEFLGARALVVGGSRGLGELTAKIIASGGGNVIITYSLGKIDAENLVTEINGLGRGRCSTLAYDVTGSAIEQLSSLEEGPTHIYYYATPPIFTKGSGFLSYPRLQQFNDFYLTGFLKLIEASRARWDHGLVVFYPSSVAINERPAQMTEYAMAKAAGEILCEDINKYMDDIDVVVERLPRLPTDQTATLRQVSAADPLQTILPIVHKVQARSGRRKKTPINYSISKEF